MAKQLDGSRRNLACRLRLRPGHIVLDQDQAPPPPKGHSPPIFGPYLLLPNDFMYQDVTWYGARPRPRRLRVSRGPRCPLPKRGGGARPKFSAHVYCRQTAGWMKLVLGMKVGLIPGDFVLHGVGDPAPVPQKGRSLLPNFRPISIVAKRLHGSRCHFVRR